MNPTVVQLTVLIRTPFAFVRLENLPSFSVLHDSARKFAPAYYRTTLR
jgi:hypothetical protein